MPHILGFFLKISIANIRKVTHLSKLTHLSNSLQVAHFAYGHVCNGTNVLYLEVLLLAHPGGYSFPSSSLTVIAYNTIVHYNNILGSWNTDMPTFSA